MMFGLYSFLYWLNCMAGSNNYLTIDRRLLCRMSGLCNSISLKQCISGEYCKHCLTKNRLRTCRMLGQSKPIIAKKNMLDMCCLLNCSFRLLYWMICTRLRLLLNRTMSRNNSRLDSMSMLGMWLLCNKFRTSCRLSLCMKPYHCNYLCLKRSIFAGSFLSLLLEVYTTGRRLLCRKRCHSSSRHLKKCS